jgi:GNAT superfamily N-acetyltransferase
VRLLLQSFDIQERWEIAFEMNIRSLEEGDRAAWERLFDEYAAFYKTSIPSGGHVKVWDWIFDGDNPFWCAVAVDSQDEPYGFTQYQLMHDSLSASMVCYLSDLYVRPDQREAGTGRALIDHVLAFAHERGIKDVTWLTQEFNYRARQLYDSYQPKSDFILYSIPIEP